MSIGHEHWLWDYASPYIEHRACTHPCAHARSTLDDLRVAGWRTHAQVTMEQHDMDGGEGGDDEAWDPADDDDAWDEAGEIVLEQVKRLPPSLAPPAWSIQTPELAYAGSALRKARSAVATTPSP